jgi:hypothetical protein
MIFSVAGSVIYSRRLSVVFVITDDRLRMVATVMIFSIAGSAIYGRGQNVVGVAISPGYGTPHLHQDQPTP